MVDLSPLAPCQIQQTSLKVIGKLYVYVCSFHTENSGNNKSQTHAGSWRLFHHFPSIDKIFLS